MHKLTVFPKIMLALVLCLTSLAGHAQKEKAEKDLEELRSWVDSKLNRADAATREERTHLKEQFQKLAANVEQGANKLSEKSKAEYRDLKSRYNQWEAKQQELSSLYIDKDELRRWQAQLLGTYQEIPKIKGADMRDAYSTFMTNVREKRRGWEAEDWVYAEEVLGRLNDRRDQVDASLSTGDRIKIQTLKAEFGTLKAGKNAREILKENR